MVALAAPGGGGRPVSRGKPAPRPAVRLPAGRVAAGVSRPKPAAKPRPHPAVHRATLMAKFTSPKPSKSVLFPTVGPGAKGGGGGIMTPTVPQGSKPPTRSGRVNIPHPTGPISPYANPFAGSKSLSPARIDMGVDYFGKGNIGAVGPGVITASGNAWSGAVGAPSPGGWIVEKISSGPLKGQQVYVAEDVQSLVKTGQTVKAGQPIAQFVAGSGSNIHYAIETGFAAPGSAGQQGQTMAAATGQSAGGGDPGARSTAWGVAYSKILHALGAPGGILTPGGITGSAPSFGTGGKVLPSRVSLPSVPALPVVSGVNPPASGGSTGRGVVAKATAQTRRPPGPPVKLPGPPTTGTPPPVTVPPVTTTTGATGTTTTATVPPAFIFSSTGTGGIGSNVAQPVASGTTGASSNLGKYLLVGGAALVVLLLVLRKKPVKR